MGLLQELHELPGGLLEAASDELDGILGAPTLIHLSGEREPALFVTVLMHGNETVGWDAIRALLAERLRRFGSLRLPRSLSLFIGNVSAAAARVRHLPGQPDYNRVWPGTELASTPEHELMGQVVARMAERGVFASVDVHNNTGCNPHYACINRLDDHFLHLASLFARTIVYFTRPRGVQSLAMAELCPAVTLECGKVGEALGVEHARDYLDACLRLSALPNHPVAAQDIDLYHTVARVRLAADTSFAFAPGEGDIVLSPELERLNFCELPRGTALGRVIGNDDFRLEVRDDLGRDVGEDYFQIEDGELRLKRAVTPSMLTRNEVIIRQDCLCYLMERCDAQLPSRK
ncbi:succinylglutamate desuccinylase [Thioflavicoccus mobilis 8321]|uniref:Succinylglutamate desuccinylase n=1 Tax=Thioflavicoccus mobilis 8321 TaxID=765912 RepID=L0GQH5_9GAMM|nr:M14 family metallopeptidase [Thioflavicoccus mobilis]AGA88983.1 succinylglutamate desuccinylase [Thioflavicoccus mobilis 8321]